MNAPSSERPLRRDLAWIFCWALFVRALYLFSIHDAYFFSHLQVEALRYDEWAKLLLGAGEPPRPPFEQSPGYPYLLALVYAVFGQHALAIASVQAVLDALSCSLVTLIGAQQFNRRIGVAGGAIAIGYAPLLYFVGEVLPATLFVFLLLAAVALSLRGRFVVAGLVWACALLVRSELVLALPFILADAWHRGGRTKALHALTPLVACLTALAVLQSAGEGPPVVLTTSGGLNLWLGNNPESDGVNPFAFGSIAESVQEVVARKLPAAQVDALFRDRALGFMRDQPGHAARLVLKKLLWTLSDRELPNSSDIDWQNAKSFLFARPLFPWGMGYVLPFALLGLWCARKRAAELALLLGLVALGVGTCVLFFTNARFRLPAAPALILFAAVGLDSVMRLFAQRGLGARAFAAPLVALSIGVTAAWGNAFEVRRYRVPELSINAGIQERESGNLRYAVFYLRDGLRDRPSDAIGRIHLALALEQTGDVAGALAAYLDGLTSTPHQADLRRMASQFFARQGFAPDVADEYVSAVSEAGQREIRRALLAALAEAAVR